MAIHERYLELRAMSVWGKYATRKFNLDELPKALRVIDNNYCRCAWFELNLVEEDTEDGAYMTLVIDEEMYRLKREG